MTKKKKSHVVVKEEGDPITPPFTYDDGVVSSNEGWEYSIKAAVLRQLQ